MPFPLFVLLLLLTLATAVLLVGRFVLPAKRTVTGIALLVFWCCLLIGPVQLLAALNLGGLRSFLNASDLFLVSGLAFACALALWLTGRRTFETAKQVRLRLPWHVSAGLLILAGTYCAYCLEMALSFPDTWDSVTYHYPLALQWLQDGTMRITGATNWHASLPGNVEILQLLVLSTRIERLLGVVQWPAILILLLACLELSRKVCKSRAAEWPVVTTALMIPIVVNQSVAGYVDLFGTALLVASLTLLLEYSDQAKNNGEKPREALLFAAGLAAGLAVGAKPVFWFFAAALALCTYFLLSSRRLAMFLIAGSVPSLFWFARAAVCTGNPLYPFALHVGSLSLPGISPSDITRPDYYLTTVRHWTELFIYPWIEWKSSPGSLLLNYTPEDGLGGGFATFATTGVLFAGWLARRRRPELRIWLFALGLLAIMWWFFLGKLIRFGLPLCVLAIVLSAPFFEVLELRPTRLYRLVYILVFAVTASVLVFRPLTTIAQTVHYRRWTRAAYWEYPPVIDTLRPGSRILNLAGERLNFPLAGMGLTNRVVPGWEQSPPLTLDFLRSRHVDYIVELIEDGSAVDKGPPAEGLELFFKGSVAKAQEQAPEWRIWSTATHLSGLKAALPE